MNSKISIRPFSGECRASILPPGSKSLTNRALMLSALAGGKTVLTGALFSRDTEIMMDCLSRLGYMVSSDRFERTMTVESAAGEIPNSEASLYVGNAGTAARFITALAALRKGGNYLFDSDPAMYSRPMRGLIEALKSQGTEFEFLGQEYRFPFRMRTCGLRGGNVKIDASASSQMLSALLMVSPLADSQMSVELSLTTVSRPFVDMTLKAMAEFGFSVSAAGSKFAAQAARRTSAERVYAVEPDATAASYFAILPAIVGGVCEIENFGDCKLQGDVKFVSILKGIGLVETRKVGRNLLVMRPENASFPESVELDFNDVSDTFLTLAAVSPALPFTLTIRGISHTRRQETDRVRAVSAELRKFCASVNETEDSIKIVPLARAELLSRVGDSRICVETYDDHRIAMSFAVLGSLDLRGDGSKWLSIENPECTSKTWKEFFEVLYTANADSKEMRVVAVDGGAAVGKSSVSRECSRILNYMHVDTGAHYRTVAHALLERDISPFEEAKVAQALGSMGLGTVLLGNSARMSLSGNLVDDSLLRTERINSKVAEFAALPCVRNFLRDYQRSMADFARSAGYCGIIMEGRDIGSVIFPDANLKVFLEADEATRAARRANEGIGDSIRKRDEMDSSRKTAPLVVPDGAEIIDTSAMNKDEVVYKTLSLIVES